MIKAIRYLYLTMTFEAELTNGLCVDFSANRLCPELGLLGRPNKEQLENAKTKAQILIDSSQGRSVTL